jgi:hypothetical protein
MTKHLVIGNFVPIVSLQSALLREQASWPTDRSLTALAGNDNLRHPRRPAC